MDRVQEINIPETIRGPEPSLELIDGMVVDVFSKFRSGKSNETAWMLPDAAAYSQLPDSWPHTKILIEDDNWKLIIAKRGVDEYWPIHSEIKVYQRSSEGLFLDQFTCYRNIVKPTMHIFSEQDQDGNFRKEVFDHLFSNNLLTKRDVLLRQVGVLASNVKSRQKLQKAYQNGNRLMRLWERHYAGFSPDLGEY
jgi:hypothetical protein